MTVVSLEEVRQSRAERQAVIEADAHEIMRVSLAYGRLLATDAYTKTSALPGSDRHLESVVERFVLRQGLTRSRRAWRKEYGAERGLALAAAAATIVRAAYWTVLDEMHPLTCERRGIAIPVVRGWADRIKASS